MKTEGAGHVMTFMAVFEDGLFRILDAIFNFGNPKVPGIPRDRPAEYRRLRAIHRLERWRQKHAA